MSYIQQNKEAWEEAFDNRKLGWGEDNHATLQRERLPFLTPDFIEELKQIDLAGKTIAQFCCNNGRELLSLMQLGAAHGVGFDIAENLIAQARETARKANIGCDFVSCNVLDIGPEWDAAFDLAFFTIGAITWFEELKALFRVVSRCLKPGGILLIQDFHAFMNMLPLPGDDAFDKQSPGKIAYSYFRTEPWIENTGMGYMTPEYRSKTFTSFSHTTSAVINAVIASGMAIEKFDEFDYDVGLSSVYDHKGLPLSYILRAKKDAR